MGQVYFERRISAARGSDSVAADIMRHLHTRQHLGKALVICDQPQIFLSAARKQWLKLSRIIQKQRSSTLNADKILKYTHTITRMQHMHFSTKSPLEQPEADIYFLLPSQLDPLPFGCFSTYVLTPVSPDLLARMRTDLPDESLVIDYDHSVQWRQAGFAPKSVLETHVQQEWQKVRAYLREQSIDPTHLRKDSEYLIDSMDDALDTLLNVSRRFLQVANDFQHALELARPLRISKETRQQYDAVVLLAHRVQALSPGAFTQRFLEAYNEDDTFFLYDAAYDLTQTPGSGESLEQAGHRHKAAGRHPLARAIKETHEQQALSLRGRTDDFRSVVL